MTNAEIKELFKRFGTSIDGDDVWEVQQATVIKHKALERLAASAGVVWERPTVLRAERDEAVVLVTGTLSDRSEWSIGEALINANYRVGGKQAPYVYAMAEKRAKDRVIIKLCGLHGLYSEDEADEFRDAAPAGAKIEMPHSEPEKPAPEKVGKAAANDSYTFNEVAPKGVFIDLWETAWARSGAGTTSYQRFWLEDATTEEKRILNPWHEDFKARAANNSPRVANEFGVA